MNPKRIFIDDQAAQRELTMRILAALPDAERIPLRPGQPLPLPQEPRRRFVAAKRALHLTVHKGDLVRPLTRPYGYDRSEFYLYAETGCPFDCQYCFLQDWLSSPVPTIHVNREGLAESIVDAANSVGGLAYLHVGEMADAFALDRLTGLSAEIGKACRMRNGLICEMRTKSDEIDGVLNDGPLENRILSWTLAPEKFVSQFEPRTASLKKRLKAIEKASAQGHPIALRFDPVICIGDFENQYEMLMDDVAAHLSNPPVDISTGSLRMTTPCLQRAKHRFVRSRIFAGELVPCSDGKWRYAQVLRRRAYDIIMEGAARHWNQSVRLCMEPGDGVAP